MPALCAPVIILRCFPYAGHVLRRARRGGLLLEAVRGGNKAEQAWRVVPVPRIAEGWQVMSMDRASPRTSISSGPSTGQMADAYK